MEGQLLKRFRVGPPSENAVQLDDRDMRRESHIDFSEEGKKS
jgi:hypothetical protein